MGALWWVDVHNQHYSSSSSSTAGTTRIISNTTYAVPGIYSCYQLPVLGRCTILRTLNNYEYVHTYVFAACSVCVWCLGYLVGEQRKKEDTAAAYQVYIVRYVRLKMLQATTAARCVAAISYSAAAAACCALLCVCLW